MRLDVHNTRATDGEHLWKTVDEYNQTYWSGLDARFYANDVFLEEITGLSYQLQEAVNPLFSYASYTVDSYLHGVRRVQGQVSINFKREAWLFELLRQLSQPDTQDAGPGDDRASQAYQQAKSGLATVEHFVALAAADGPVPRDAQGRLQLDPDLLDRVAQDFERALWDPTPTGKAQKLGLTERLAETGPRFFVPGEWDLSIQFGSTPEARRREHAITAEVGETEVPSFAVTTATRLVGMVLTGVSREIDDSGRPVAEVYSFLARDVR